MTDCMSCRHAVPARAPDGSVDFRIKNCKRFPPTPIVLMGPNNVPMMSAAFPTVGPGVSCAEHAPREESICCSHYAGARPDGLFGPCRYCGFPKAAHEDVAARIAASKEDNACATCGAKWHRSPERIGKLLRIHLKGDSCGFPQFEEVAAP